MGDLVESFASRGQQHHSQRHRQTGWRKQHVLVIRHSGLFDRLVHVDRELCRAFRDQVEHLEKTEKIISLFFFVIAVIEILVEKF